jgi:hypothetical protein
MAGHVAPDSLSESERLDIVADQAIALARGDMRSAIRALILANEYLEGEIAELVMAVSNGYARGRGRRREDVA